MSSADGAVGRFLDEIEPVVFAFGAAITLLFVGAFSLNPEASYEFVLGIRRWILATFNWFFLLAMLGFVLFLGFVIFGPWGNLKLGDEDPEYSFLSYFAMMYSAGLAAGIVFWGPAEALFHYSTVPPLYGAEAQSAAAMPLAVQYSIFHWSLTQWFVFHCDGTRHRLLRLQLRRAASRVGGPDAGARRGQRRRRDRETRRHPRRVRDPRRRRDFAGIHREPVHHRPELPVGNPTRRRGDHPRHHGHGRHLHHLVGAGRRQGDSPALELQHGSCSPC